MKKALLSFIIIAVLLFPSFSANGSSHLQMGGKAEGHAMPLFNRGIFPFLFSFISSSIKISNSGGIDQKQENADGYVEIYGTRYFAQSFRPSMCRLTGLDIYMGRKGLAIKETKIGREYSAKLDFGLGNLFIGIYKELGNTFSENRIVHVILSPQNISRRGGWIHIDFNADITLSYNKTYYMVVYQDGGNERNYYKWYYGGGDLYIRGASYETDSYPWDWKEKDDKDFCFRTYGELTCDEPDGVVERWAVLVGVLEDKWGDIAYYADQDAYDMRDVLLHHGWQSDHIKTLISPKRSGIRSAIKWLDSMDDGDDIIMLTVTAHGGIDINNGKGGITAYDGVFYYYQMDELLDECDAEGELVLIDSCQSGSAIPDMAHEGRIIITACNRYQSSYWNDEMKNGMFTYFFVDETGVWSNKYNYPTPKMDKDGAFARDDPDTSADYGGNNDGWISAEEAFHYAEKWYKEVVRRTSHPPSTPQISDMYDGDLLIARRL